MTAYAIAVTALLIGVLVTAAYEHRLRMKAESDGAEAEEELRKAKDLLIGYRIEKANRDGVDAGHAADTMYRQFLEQFSQKEQAIVMLRGDATYYAKHG